MEARGPGGRWVVVTFLIRFLDFGLAIFVCDTLRY